ncbi:Nucleolar protein 4 [Holothuria leucospilota]|uniref:Nucleolar protein 4 n=1 Tax=Holothuria leucospilota TaxID=206669 RepID=A0A9Q1H4H3_HOLLE|nr:Nucleolar protein 4 [Holothuria leucospilota]
MGKLICSDEVNISRYRDWALRNYGDSGKTKTVTKRKYERIVKVLRGKDRFSGSASSENGKFRFWVRGKGFKLGKPLGYPVVGLGDEVLLVPVKTTNSDGTIIDKGYKQVAVVEDFYDIIYNVHVQTEGKEGKHAGQKRTYRAVAEKFAFLPREAVTRFLMSCKDCKTRMQLTFESSDKKKESQLSAETKDHELENEVPDIRYSLPITTTYMSHLRNLQYLSETEVRLWHHFKISFTLQMLGPPRFLESVDTTRLAVQSNTEQASFISTKYTNMEECPLTQNTL